MKIEAPITPSEEQIQAHYDENKEKYDTPAERVVDFVAVSLTPPAPPLAEELVKRARDGEDFAELVKEYSDAAGAERGGVIEWMPEVPSLPDYMRPMFDLAPGEISDPVPSASGYYIFKVEEERREGSDESREIRGRQLLLRAELSEDERQARLEKAEAILAKAEEAGDLAAAATEAGLPVQTSGSFSSKTSRVENIPPSDAYGLRKGCEDKEMGDIVGVVKGRENFYVAKVTQVTPAVTRPLEEVRDQVEEDVRRELRISEDYAKQVQELADSIGEEAKSLDDVLRLRPELEAKIEETKPFTVQKSPVVPGTTLASKNVYMLVKGHEPGFFMGPVAGRVGPERYFLELTELSLPGGDEWTEQKRNEEMKKLRDAALNRAQYARLADYIKYLKGNTFINYDSGAFNSVIGDREPPAEEENAAEAEPVPEDTADDKG